jgi:putative membrane protein
VLIVGSILALAAALLHAVIFYLESIAWGSARAQGVFGAQSDEEVVITRSLAFNQGFYNLFLGIAAGLGAVLALAGVTTVGVTLMLVGAGSMLAAALVLLLSSPSHRGAAVKQGTLPLLAVLALLVSLAI